MDMKTLGNNRSKDRDKSRPKSHHTDPAKQKSMEYVQDITTCEDIDNNNVTSPDTSRSEYKEYVIDPNLLKSENLQQVGNENPRIPVKVMKVIPSTKAEKTKPKEKVLIARNLPKSEPFSNCNTMYASKEFSENRIKPHSILGTLEDYKMGEAISKGDGETLRIIDNDDEPTIFFDEIKTIENVPVVKGDSVHIDEKNALNNWRKQMKGRQKQQGHLSKHLAISSEMLLMNQSDLYRSIQEERTLIDRSMPTKDYGKGYRVGSEFWKQTETLGSDERVNITLSKTEKGNVPSIEHVGYPSAIKNEMGTDWKMTHRMKYTHYPWWKSEYLHERQKHLQDVINELNPHKADLNELEVIGKSVNFECEDDTTVECDVEMPDEEITDSDLAVPKDPLADYDNVIPQHIFEPSLSINGLSARWQKDGSSSNGVIERLLFTSEILTTQKKAVKIENDGTTVIHYLWKKLPEYNPFNINKGRPLKRFFFNVSDGVILPGDSVELPFIFKSPNAGIFSETWQLETLPVLCGKSNIQISLHGIATEHDEFEEDRNKLEKYLEEKQKKVMAERILVGILASIKTPERPSTPSDNYITEDELFNKKNEKLHFKLESVKKLKAFHDEFNPDTEWDLSLDTLVENVATLEEEDKESAFLRLNADIKELNHSNMTLAPSSKYDVCYLVLCDAFDKFSSRAQKLNVAFGYPEKELVVKSSSENTSKKNKKADPEITSKSRAETRTSKKDSNSKNKVGKEKGKRDVTSNKQTDNDSESITEIVSTTPANANYTEKLYMEIYDCLSEMAVNLESVLSS